MKNVNFHPNGDRILIETLDQDDKRASGLIIPSESKEKPDKGVVMAVGPGEEGKPVTVSEGDIVLYGKDTGMKVKIENKEFLIMRNIDIYGTIK